MKDFDVLPNTPLKLSENKKVINSQINKSEKVLNWLFKRQRFLNPTLERTLKLLRWLDDPQNSFASILVGGTNGKGSTTSTLSTILHSSGKKTARFTSPHLSYFAERFWVSGMALPQEEVIVQLKAIKPYAEEIDASFFEIITALACQLFAKHSVEIAVMEVGLGGRFDSTNSLEPILSIVTNVALEHTKILGNTLTEIAHDKAHIMRPLRPCFTGAKGEALIALKNHARKTKAQLITLEEISFEINKMTWQGTEFSLQPDLSIHTPLIGGHQVENVILAVLAAQKLGVLKEDIQKGVGLTSWPGRLEPITYKERIFLLDCAHNPAAVKALVKSLQNLQVKDLVLIFGASADKDIASMVALLEPLAKRVILTGVTKSARASAAKELGKFWSIPKHFCSSPSTALEYALKISMGDEFLLVVGSIYLISEMRGLLLQQPSEPWLRWQ